MRLGDGHGSSSSSCSRSERTASIELHISCFAARAVNAHHLTRALRRAGRAAAAGFSDTPPPPKIYERRWRQSASVVNSPFADERQLQVNKVC